MPVLLQCVRGFAAVDLVSCLILVVSHSGIYMYYSIHLHAENLALELILIPALELRN